MFEDAVRKVSCFTFPVIHIKTIFNGELHRFCGTYIVLNKDGWILTAAHNIEDLIIVKDQKSEIEKYKVEVEKINANKNLTKKKKDKSIRKIRNNDWIIKQQYIWGRPDIQIKDIHVYKDVDLAIARLDPFDSNWVSLCPKFKDPSEEYSIGSNLFCLGFPPRFIRANENEKGLDISFDLPSKIDKSEQHANPLNTIPLPHFPISGILVRSGVFLGKDVRIIEMSFPSYPGMSGGPIFDKNGIVWGIMTGSTRYDLKTLEPRTIDNKEFGDLRQFIYISEGAHVFEILKIFKSKKIEFEIT